MLRMRFDFVIGNPPYQVEAPGLSTSEKPVYHYFVDETYKVADVVELIMPARFLFNAGATPKDWNRKMLNSKHLKVLYYESDAKHVFPIAEITGGIVVTYHNRKLEFEPIKSFIPYPELNSMCQKVVNYSGFSSISNLISGRTPYLFTDVLHIENPDASERLSEGHKYDISSNAFASLPEIFLGECPSVANNYYRVIGRIDNKRVYRWIKKMYARGRTDDIIGKWKVFLPKANGASGMLGQEAARLISKPEIGAPYDIATDTFICLGSFDTEKEANAALWYITSKFARVLLGTLKVTQINSKETWANVPIQDFTSASDIDWSSSISDIDKQLYKKYGLTDDEIEFIETHVKEMV